MMLAALGLGNLAHAELPSPMYEAHFMGMPATIRWTAEMVRALPDDGKPYEVIDGTGKSNGGWIPHTRH
jgi:hypothetical protein